MWYGWFAYTLPKEYLLPSLTEVYVYVYVRAVS